MMRAVKLSDEAIADIGTITLYTAITFGRAQAILYEDELNKQFELLAEYPGLGRTILSAKYPNAQKFGFGSHMIVFSHDDSALTVHRILHARSNYTRYL